MDEENVELQPDLEEQDDSISDKSETESKDEKIDNSIRKKKNIKMRRMLDKIQSSEDELKEPSNEELVKNSQPPQKKTSSNKKKIKMLTPRKNSKRKGKKIDG